MQGKQLLKQQLFSLIESLRSSLKLLKMQQNVILNQDLKPIKE